MNKILSISKIKKFLPSRMVTAFVVVPFFALVIFFILKNIYFPEEIRKKDFQEKKLEELNEYINIDTDGDGLLDWEEKLYKTDIKQKDTDGDGLSDYFEIATNTDPLDFLNTKSKEEAYKKEEEEAKKLKVDRTKLNVTEKVAQELLNKTRQLHNSGLVFNDSAQSQAADMILEKARLNFKNKYTKKDLNISNELSKEDFRKSFVKLNKKLYGMVKDLNLQLEPELLLSYFRTSDKKYLKELERNLEMQKLTLSKYLKLEIPADLTDIWLEYLNLLNNSTEIIKIFSNSDQDPMAALSALTVYRKIVAEIVKSLNTINLYFNK